MGTKLYVGNQAYSVDRDQLQQIFSDCGMVASAKVITDKFSGRSKGFGFVEMDSPDGVQKALANLDGREIDGRPLRVSEARPQEPRERPSYSRDNDRDRGGNW